MTYEPSIFFFCYWLFPFDSISTPRWLLTVADEADSWGDWCCCEGRWVRLPFLFSFLFSCSCRWEFIREMTYESLTSLNIVFRDAVLRFSRWETPRSLLLYMDQGRLEYFCSLFVPISFTLHTMDFKLLFWNISLASWLVRLAYWSFFVIFFSIHVVNYSSDILAFRLRGCIFNSCNRNIWILRFKSCNIPYQILNNKFSVVCTLF